LGSGLAVWVQPEATFWPPTKMANSGEFVSGLTSAGLPELKPGRAWQDHEYLFCQQFIINSQNGLTFKITLC